MSIVVRLEGRPEVELDSINDVWVLISSAFPSPYSNDMFFSIEGEAYVVSDLQWRRDCPTVAAFIDYLDWDRE